MNGVESPRRVASHHVPCVKIEVEVLFQVYEKMKESISVVRAMEAVVSFD